MSSVELVSLALVPKKPWAKLTEWIYFEIHGFPFPNQCAIFNCNFLANVNKKLW